MKNFIAILRRYSIAMIMNFAGLVLALTAFMVLMLQISYQVEFDKGHPTSGRIYRVDKIGAVDDDIFKNIIPRGYADDIIGSSPHIIAGTIDCPFIGETVFNAILEDGMPPFVFKSKTDVIYPDFFKVFGTKFIEGSAEALNDLSQIAIPESLAKKLYGNESAIGHILTHNEGYQFGAGRTKEFSVGAVYKDFPANSQIGNHIYLNVGSLHEGNYGGANFACWVLLDSADNKELVEQNFNDNYNYTDSDWLTDIELTPIEEIYFGDEGSTIWKTGSRKQVWILICISILVMLIGGINYATFFTSLAPMRVKAVNTRKVLGSSIGKLRGELMLEAVLFSLAAFIVALGVMYPVSDWLVALGVSDMTFDFTSKLSLVLITGLISIVIGLAAGVYPSFYVTSLPTAFALQGNFAFSVAGRRFRTVMITLQFAIAFALMIFALTVYRQNKYMTGYDTGFEKDRIAVVQISAEQYQFKSEWLQERLCSLPEVEDVAFALEGMGFSDSYSTFTLELEGQQVRCFSIYCSHNFLDVMGIPVVDGRNFLVSDVGNAIMNQRLKDLGGKIEITEGMGSIIGQTSDVRINSLRNETAPICYIYVPKDFATLGYVYIRLQNGYDKTGVTEKINAILTEMDPSYLFEVEYYEEVMERVYESEIRQGKIISIFSLLAAALSLIGVFGQVLLDVQYRRRDLAVKKVYGAETAGLMLDGLKRYAIIGIVSYAIAVPAAHYAVSRWLENFVEHTGLSAWTFILTFVVIMILTIGVAGFQYWNSANADPAEALRKE
ncbi:MAG: FtsX-like permease family protein [Bacteroidales bacterium]|nr:FtsX-like permease family protein [Bacteroidales bacterium]